MWETLLGLAVVAGGGWWLCFRFWNRVTLLEYERGVWFHRGRFRALLEPGVYWIFRPESRIQVVSGQLRTVTIPGQEVLSSDNVAVRISLALAYQVRDFAKAVLQYEKVEDALYLEAQVLLRDVVGRVSVDNLLAQREQIGQDLRARLTERAREMGLEIASFGIKDVMFPGELKKIFARVVEAERQSQASLVKARGEQATLRSLLNSARLLRDHPGLLALRTLQTISDFGASGRNTLVVGFPGGTMPPLVISDEADKSAAPPGPPAGHPPDDDATESD